jgi:MFS superfamily sulfate permease-like transporter
MNSSVIVNQLTNLVMMLFLIALLVALLFFLGWGLVIWYKWKDREERSIKQINLLVAIPKDNEVKIDAM